MTAPRAVTRGEFDSARFAVGVDWLAWTYFPSADDWKSELAGVLWRLFGVEGWEVRGGWQGYECSARCEEVLIAWGGTAQRGSVHVEVPGSVCGAVTAWPEVAEWLEGTGARLTRVDVAGDDFYGERVTVPWAVEAFHAGGFSFQGTPPSARLVDDLGSGAGKTLYVGKRENGKLCRVYEKGRQLGDALSTWVRFEVEWRAKNRTLSYDMLTRPAEYLAGAYPCASLFARVCSRVRTFKQRASITYQQMVSIARHQCGRAVNAILQVVGGDIGEVVSLLRRGGMPKRFSARDLIALTG